MVSFWLFGGCSGLLGCFFWRLEPKTRFFERKNVDKTWSIVWWLWFFRWLFVVELWFEEAAAGQTIYEAITKFADPWHPFRVYQPETRNSEESGQDASLSDLACSH